MLVTSIFSFSHKVFNPIKDTNYYFSATFHLLTAQAFNGKEGRVQPWSWCRTTAFQTFGLEFDPWGQVSASGQLKLALRFSPGTGIVPRKESQETSVKIVRTSFSIAANKYV